MPALALELLARAALTKMHPALNADPRDEKNLFYALGFPIVEQPRSIPAHAVYLRLEKLLDGFQRPQREFCDYMGLQRNVDLHTGDVAFGATRAGAWLPRFYSVCKILCKSLGKSLTDFLGPDVAVSAEAIVAAFAVDQENSVRQKIAERRRAFEALSDDERGAKIAEAAQLVGLLPLRSVRRDCPACGTPGILQGQLIKELQPVYEDGELLVDEEYLARSFKCLACGLHLTTIDEVGLAGIDLRFTQRTSTSLHDYAEPEFDYDYENM